MRKLIVLLVFLTGCGGSYDDYGCGKRINDYPELLTYYCEGDEMAVRFVTPNLIDDIDNDEFTGSSEADGFPFENVKDARLTRRWRNSAALNILDTCDAIGNWDGIAAESQTPTLNTTTKQEGDASLNLIKTGATQAVATWDTTQATTLDGTGKNLQLWLYIDDVNDFQNTVNGIQVIVGNDNATFFRKKFNPTASFSNGWNAIDEDISAMEDVGGADITALDYLSIQTTLSAAGIQFVAGEFMMDFWRLTPVTEYIDIDLGSAQAVNTAIIDGHDLESGDTNIKVWYSDDESAYTEAAEFTHDEGTMVEFFAATETHRYWRFGYTVADADEIRNIGRVFLGVFTQPTRTFDLNRTIEHFDPSKMRKSRAQTTYGDVKNIWQKIKFKLKMEPKAGVDTLEALLKDVGIHTALWINLDQNSPNGDNTVYGYLKKGFKRVDPLDTHGSMDFELEEDL